ncbi:hypothetical protein MARCHEWKA_04580 [Brevundimonas phage vB_BpoS-Marchewka]|uniref:Uncharacterized protein n=1 Tax=Brevundimonas phage vB_BpoS-Marchewka TaxID=2948604 RepID=A0A9E7STD1_9CAUD|nr:hypothetical protein MARCHEWKA_04580 [Brevundimonas phage vB_BpoS-Marchewka]UTC29414.1 hypothetical protein BAMBUS_03320 [Brevundimonas phage vB_BpoS-Bambus]
MYAIIMSDARTIGKKPALKLGWVTKSLPDGGVRANVAPLTSLRNPKWSKTTRYVRGNQIAQMFGPNVKPTTAEIKAIRDRLKPYQPRAEGFADMGHYGGV